MFNSLRRWYRPALGRTIRNSATRRPRTSKPRLEALEDRTVPTVLDLTNPAVLASGTVTGSGAGASTGAIFTDTTAHNTSGSGVFSPFVRFEAKAADNGIEQGVNSNFPSSSILQDVDAGGTKFNHALQLSQLPV